MPYLSPKLLQFQQVVHLRDCLRFQVLSVLIQPTYSHQCMTMCKWIKGNLKRQGLYVLNKCRPFSTATGPNSDIKLNANHITYLHI